MALGFNGLETQRFNGFSSEIPGLGILIFWDRVKVKFPKPRQPVAGTYAQVSNLKVDRKTDSQTYQRFSKLVSN